jgi:SAM-dependent methyltransferase
VSARTLITSRLRTLLYGRPPSPDAIGQWGYRDQTKTWGIRLPYYHFTQAHLFDLLHGTDTRLAVVKNSYTETPAGFENGTFYTPSWTSEIKASFEFLRNLLGGEFDKYAFVDVGCGKGKVMLVWQYLLNKNSIEAAVYGVEYSHALSNIAKSNFLKMFGKECDLIVADAASIDLSRFGRKLIVYMYNPFHGETLERFLTKLAPMEAIVVYNTPWHSSAFKEQLYELIYETHGWHNLLRTKFFRTRHSSVPREGP